MSTSINIYRTPEFQTNPTPNPEREKVRETTVKNPWKDSEKPVKTNQKLEHGNHIFLFRTLRIDLRIRLGSGERSPFFDL